MLRHRRDDELELARKLDQSFEEILARVRPYLLGLDDPSDSRLCRAWLDRLNRAEDQRNLRNDYLLELYKQLRSDGQLRAPFTKPPESGRLIPISKVQRLATSSSWNELTETTSLSPCEQRRSNLPKPRSKSLRRDNARVKPPTRSYFDVHSSSPQRSVPSSPTVHFCEHDSRADRNLLRTYKERIETLSTIIEELGKQNDKLKQKLAYYHNANSAPNEIPHLHARIKQLVDEVANLKNKLSEVHEIKEILEKNHTNIVGQYKKRMTEQFNKMKKQLEAARNENQGLNSKIAVIEQKLRDLSHEKEESVNSKDKSWTQKMESMKAEYEKLLREKESELRMKNEIVQQKEMELTQKLGEINSMNEKIQELQQLIDSKSQDDGNLQSMLLEQYRTIKDELSKMRENIEIASKRQSDSHHQEISDLNRNVLKLEKYTQRLQQEYEKRIYHAVKEKERAISSLHKCLQYKPVSPGTMSFSEKHCEIGAGHISSSFEHRYRDLLHELESVADDQRCKLYEKLSFLDNQICRMGYG